MALVKRAQEYIEDCFDRASLSDLAKQMGVPLYYYSRLISQHTGQSFKKLLMHRRLFYAAHLLASSGVSVLDVIACTGYSNASHFYRIFAQNYGMTPAEYRLYHTNRQDDLAGCHPAD